MKLIKKNILVFLLLVIFFFIFFKVIYGPGTASKMDNLFRFHTCLELLEDGKLYSQYACWHGPIVYYTYYLFKIIFGSYFVLASSVILNALALFAILYLVWKQTNKNKFIIPVLLYLALVIPLIADFFSLAAELVASVYMLFGVILLQYWKSKAKPFFTSLLFTFSILSSQVALVPIVLFLFVYFLSNMQKPYIKHITNLIKSNRMQLLYILLPILILNFLFAWLHKDFIRFVYLGFAAAKATSWSNAVVQTITTFATPDLIKLPLTVMLVVALYSLFKSRNKYFATFFFSIIIFTIINVKAYPVYDLFDVYLIYSNKFVPYISFFIVGFSIFINRIQFNFNKAIIFSVVLSTLIYPGLDKLYLYEKINGLDDLLLAPLGSLGVGENILSNNDKFTRYGTKYENLDLVKGRDIFIGIKNEFLPHAKWVNLTEERKRVFEEQRGRLFSIYEKLANREYSLVTYGPDTFELDLHWLIIATNYTSNTGNAALDDYCFMYFPSVEHGCAGCKFLIRTFVKDHNKCKEFFPSVLKHYTENFNKICKADEVVANSYVKTILSGYGYFIVDKCKNGGKLTIEFKDGAFRTDDLFNIAYLSLIILLLIRLKYKRKNEILTLASIVLIALFPLIIYNSDYDPDYYKNEILNVVEIRGPEVFRTMETQDYFPINNRPAKVVFQNFTLYIDRYGDRSSTNV